jgi:VanZ family protein
MKINTLLLTLWTLLLLAVLLSPLKEGVIPSSWGFRHFDKVVHFCLFAVTGFLGICGAGFFASFRNRLLFGFVFGLVLAAGTEFGQAFIPHRTPSLYDLQADLTGLSLGLLFCTWLYCWKLKL